MLNYYFQVLHLVNGTIFYNVFLINTIQMIFEIIFLIGVKEGGKLEYGGKRLNRPGYFLEPTIFSNVDDNMFIAKEESFGPIMVISRFNGYDILLLN